MRASICIAAILTSGVMAACSNPAPEPVSGGVTTYEDELELGIFPTEGSDGGSRVVISELEMIGPTSSSGTATAREVSAPVPGSDPELAIPHIHPKNRPAPATFDEPEIRPVVVRVGGRESGPDARGGDGRLSGVIIRGGADARDPCIIHRPGAGLLGDIGVLINDPTPSVGGGRLPREAGRSGGNSPRGGVLFAGGIR